MALAPALYHISYHDSGLTGVSGAMTVLRSYSQNPFCTRITLSHNHLGDDGVEALCSGILDLRRRGRLIAPLKELNLSSNGITDRGLDAIIRYLLLPSAPPISQLPTITELILSNNAICLSPSSSATPHLLSTALSHKTSSLVSLSLTSNTGIASSPENLRAFFKHLEPTSLVQLQLNACALEPEDARTIAVWLSDPGKGGRLAHLELNANALGTDIFGTNRLAKVVYAGLNTSLQCLELASNGRALLELDEDGEPTGTERAVPLPDSLLSDDKAGDGILLGDDLPYAELKTYLVEGLMRNVLLRVATRQTALLLLPVARVLLHAKRPRASPDDIKAQLGADAVADTFQAASLSGTPKPSIASYTTNSTLPLSPTAAAPSSPLLRLPPELISYILRVFTTLEPVALPPPPAHASTYTVAQPPQPVFASPLSETQFNRVLAIAQDRATLSGMTHRFPGGGAGRASPARGDARDQGRVSLDNKWALLGVVGCMEYQRRAA